MVVVLVLALLALGCGRPGDSPGTDETGPSKSPDWEYINLFAPSIRLQTPEEGGGYGIRERFQDPVIVAEVDRYMRWLVESKGPEPPFKPGIAGPDGVQIIAAGIYSGSEDAPSTLRGLLLDAKR